MRLAVLMDGTWNDENDDTNVNQLCGRVPQTTRGPGGEGQQKRYIKGVGTGPWDQLRGGALGYGVDDNIREGYRFIAENHQPGDQLFLLGYSRGAFTARSLAGLITKCGIVPPDILGADKLYERYRDRPGLREMQEGEDDRDKRTDQDRKVLAHARLERIQFIGVLDTVGSLGIPSNLARIYVRKYEFHDTRLSGYVDIARHAVAIDEQRHEFEPTLWTAVPIPIPGHQTSIEQRWFRRGALRHRRRRRAVAPARPLSALAREWIADEARKAGLDIDAPQSPLTGDEWKSPCAKAPWLFRITSLLPGHGP
jgi:uncharacterized protein (DUF2235 family)